MKKFIGFILALSICFIFTNTSFAASKVTEDSTIKVFISGKQVKFQNPQVTVNGEILIYANDLLPKLGVPNDTKHITLDKAKKNLVITSGNTKITMVVNSNKATVGKSSKTLNTAPTLYKNKYYIPLKSTVELLGLKYAWDGYQKSAYIQKASDYTKVKTALDKAITATKAVNKYKVVYSSEDQFDSEEDPFHMKNVSTASVDEKKQIMYISIDFEDSISGPSTGEYYLFNNYLYSKYSFSEKWEKELLPKKEYEEWILEHDVSRFKISDILYCGLSYEENTKTNMIKLKGNVYLYMNSIDYEDEPIDTYLEINITKSTNLINSITHKYSEYYDSERFSSTKSYTYKDFNGTFTVPTPDESKMEFEEEDGDSSNNEPITLSNDEENIIAALSSNADKVAVDGAWEHPYNIDVTEAIMFIVLKNSSDYNKFTDLSDDAKKVFVNQIIQDNYGEYLGCETVYGMVVYDGEMYEAVIAGYDTAAEDAVLESYPEGEPVIVVVQDKDNNTYSEY